MGDSVKKATGLSMITRSAGVFIANKKISAVQRYRPQEDALIRYILDNAENRFGPGAYKNGLRRLIESAYSPERLVLQLLWNNLIDIGQAKGLREDIASLERIAVCLWQYIGSQSIIHASQAGDKKVDYSEFGAGELYVARLHKALRDNGRGLANQVVLEQLGLTPDRVNTATENELLDAFNKILKIRDIHSTIGIEQYKSSISNKEIQYF